MGCCCSGVVFGSGVWCRYGGWNGVVGGKGIGWLGGNCCFMSVLVWCVCSGCCLGVVDVGCSV